MRGEGLHLGQLHSIMADYRGGVDYPVAMFYKELMMAYPRAKVLLTIRDGVSWYVSVRDSIHRLSVTSSKWPVSWFSELVGLTASTQLMRSVGNQPLAWSSSGLGMHAAVEAGEAAAVRFYQDHVEEVKACVPADRLLVWQVSEGWGPLCQFLGVPVPDEPFPRINDTAKIEAERRLMLAMSWFCIVIAPMGLAMVALLFRCTQPLGLVMVAGGYMLIVGILRLIMQFKIKNYDNK